MTKKLLKNFQHSVAFSKTSDIISHSNLSMCGVTISETSNSHLRGGTGGKRTLKSVHECKETQHSNNDVFESLSKSMQLILLTLGMLVFFGTHNILQEAITKIPNFKFGVMLGYMEVIGVTTGSYIERKYVAEEKGRKAPITAYPLLTLCLFLSSGLSNMSLNYINFPTKVVFRSCKLLPTMMVASIINKRVFSFVEYVLAMAVCMGLILFAAADWNLAPSFNPIGLLLVSLSVIADSVLPNAQEKLFSIGASRLEVTLYSNFFTLIAMTLTTLVSGDLFGFLKLILDEPHLIPYFCVYIVLSFIAISFFMQIVKRFGAVTGVLAAAVRKVMTLIFSFLLFPSVFSWLYVIGSGLVLGGVLLSSLIKIKRKSASNEQSNLSIGAINNGGKVRESQKLKKGADSNV